MLKVDNINLYYGVIHALKDISLEVKQGEIVTLIGANGAGKTSTLRAISGLQPLKSGTVTFDVTKAVADIKAGKVEYRVDKTAIVHVPIGKRSFGAEKLAQNFHSLMEAVIKAKPAAAKGQYLKSVVVSATMGPGVKINPTKVLD